LALSVTGTGAAVANNFLLLKNTKQHFFAGRIKSFDSGLNHFLRYFSLTRVVLHLFFGINLPSQNIFKIFEALTTSFQTQNTASAIVYAQRGAYRTKKSAFFSNFLFYPLAR
jgi:hypothetical protein